MAKKDSGNKNYASENQRMASLESWYLTDQLEFDKQMIRFRYQALRRHLRGPQGLELGSAEGQMTQLLLGHFEVLTIVDGSATLLARIHQTSNLVKVHSLFEEFEPNNKFNTIVMEHVLEHVEQPTVLLQRAKGWLENNGKILVGVPNGNSIHRLVAVKMGLLKHPCELNERDHALGHRRVYTPETLRLDIEAAGLQVQELGGVFFKPLSNNQMEKQWSREMIDGFYELGKDFPAYAAESYAVCITQN